jgi:hypothetical protein
VVSRIVIVAATLAAIVVIGIAIWFQSEPLSPPAARDAVDAPRQYDTTGGQEMRPRWDGSGGQKNDAVGN